MARDKSIIEDAYAGDVVGLFDTGNFKIGDTLTEGEDFYFTGIPSFSPEIFREVVNKDPLKTKQLEKGLLQLTDEGVAQLFTQFGGTKKIIGCVGELQFEVIQYRLLHEYGASVVFNALHHRIFVALADPGNHINRGLPNLHLSGFGVYMHVIVLSEN